MEGDSGRGELMVSAVIEKSSPNSCKQTRSSSAIGRQESLVNETTHPDSVKSLLNVEKDSSSGSASLKSRSDFFSQSE
ncbi:hypothetical protein TNCV_3172891 [Trichonephila clavipes]|nr:hypothetical protein TNCV_3172891 [Trichonephila clavipes]